MIVTNLFKTICSLLIVLSLTAASVGQTAPMTWPEAVAPLAGSKTMAEACVFLLKHFGTESQIASGVFAYNTAKSESDAVIAGLVTALASNDSPAVLPSLQSRLSSSLSGLDQFCNTVKAILPPSPPNGSKAGIIDALSIIKESIGPLLTGAMNGIAALYNDHRSDDAMTRKSIQHQLESAKWPDFAGVNAQ